jgi:hypothetical protein
MLYYLQDHSTSAIIYIDSDHFLVNNLSSGVLDCSINVFSSETSTTASLLHHRDSNISTGIKLTTSGPVEFSLVNYPDLKLKQDLVRLRSRAFRTLLEEATKYKSKNMIGFFYFDQLIIEQALKNPEWITEYATMLGISPGFAKKELEMTAESMYIDQFRVYTVCTLWKKKINQCTDQFELEKYPGQIKQSFHSPGLANV